MPCIDHELGHGVEIPRQLQRVHRNALGEHMHRTEPRAGRRFAGDARQQSRRHQRAASLGRSDRGEVWGGVSGAQRHDGAHGCGDHRVVNIHHEAGVGHVRYHSQAKGTGRIRAQFHRSIERGHSGLGRGHERAEVVAHETKPACCARQCGRGLAGAAAADEEYRAVVDHDRGRVQECGAQRGQGAREELCERPVPHDVGKRRRIRSPGHRPAGAEIDRFRAEGVAKHGEVKVCGRDPVRPGGGEHGRRHSGTRGVPRRDGERRACAAARGEGHVGKMVERGQARWRGPSGGQTQGGRGFGNELGRFDRRSARRGGETGVKRFHRPDDVGRRDVIDG